MRTRTRAVVGALLGIALTTGLTLASTVSAYAGFNFGH